MASKVFVFLFLMTLLAAGSARDVKPKRRGASMEIYRKLKALNKPAVKTIHSEDGDIIDCVDVHKQPAFDHPALKNHKIQMEPLFKFPTEEDSSTRNSSSTSLSSSTILQTWHKSGSCPKGTIPIRRILKKDLLRAPSVHQFGKMPPRRLTSGPTVPLSNLSLNLGPEVNRSTATLVTTGYNYIGAQAFINVWNPNVEPGDFSAAKVWLRNGPSKGFESVEAGWMVNPQFYGDKSTRFTVFWTVDSYQGSGCFDLTCAGFVQTNSKIVLGGVIGPISGMYGPQYGIEVAFNLEPESGNWWLKLGTEPVGYWPKGLLNYLSHSAILVEWGGEVYSANLRKSPHTTTAMGSGRFAEEKSGSACYIYNVRIVDYSLQLKYPDKVGTFADEPYCYNGLNYQERITAEPVYFFGGPGRNFNCH